MELSKIGAGTVEVRLGRSLCLSLAEIDLFLGLCLCRSNLRSRRSIRPSERCLDSARWSWSLCLSRAVCVSFVSDGTVGGFVPARAAMSAGLAEWLFASRFLATW